MRAIQITRLHVVVVGSRAVMILFALRFATVICQCRLFLALFLAIGDSSSDQGCKLSLLAGVSAEGYVWDTWFYYIEAWSSYLPQYSVVIGQYSHYSARGTTCESWRFIYPSRERAWSRLGINGTSEGDLRLELFELCDQACCQVACSQ
jgi:hypothetical protein